MAQDSEEEILPWVFIDSNEDEIEPIDLDNVPIKRRRRNMKIDRFRLRKSTSEVPPECQALIDRLCQCSRYELLIELAQIDTWVFGKCELYHWISVLDIFDTILEEATFGINPINKWALRCDHLYDPGDTKLLLWTLHFTTLLIEHSFSRHLYNSMEHLLTLLKSFDMHIVLAVLNLLYMFSKRSNFITRLANDKRDALISRLHYLAESWGGKENGFGMASCCNPEIPIPSSATTLHFEFCKDHVSDESKENITSSYIHVENVDQLNKNTADLMLGLCTVYRIPREKEMWVYTHVRLANHYGNYSARVLCVQARLQALSVLSYCNAVQDTGYTILYDGLLEELVELVQLEGSNMVDIRSAALRTLTSIIHLDRIPHFPKKPCSRLSSIIDVTGANLYHGFLPTLVRNCIMSLTRPVIKTEVLTDSIPERTFIPVVELIPYPRTDTSADFPLPLATSLFSFLYHLASYEAGGEALVSCGVLESLLQVINWHGVGLEHITFVTRAVRVIDLITNIDMHAFHSYDGLQIFISRLYTEVYICRPEQAYEFKPVETLLVHQGPSDADDEEVEEEVETSISYECQINPSNFGNTCLPQRAALLKSMLNFLKKAIQDAVFAENIRQIMEGILPNALKHIVANAEYYGPSLFLLATDLVTVYVFQDPVLLNILQDNGLADVVLYALLNKEIPVTREVLGSVPNVFSALCLNARGLQSFSKYKPFERVLKVLLSPHYLSAMRRRRSSDPLGDTASNFGNAMDELMRHQPSIKGDAIAAIVKLLQDVCQLGYEAKYICWSPHSKAEPARINIQPVNNPDASSDEEDDEEEETSTSSHNAPSDPRGLGGSSANADNNERTPIPLIDYIHNIMKFIDALLSNNSTDDHCKEFVQQDGLKPLLRILGLPNLPVDSPFTASTHAVASVCKTILNLAHEPKVFVECFYQLNGILQLLKPLFLQLESHNVSVLLEELATAPHLESALQNVDATPILHSLAAIHGYVLMLVHMCRTGQSDIRSLSLHQWGSELGLEVLTNLCNLYISLVWESTLLLAVCTDNLTSADFNIGQEYMDKLNVLIPENKGDPGNSTTEHATTIGYTMNVDETTQTKPTNQQLKYIKPLLGASSRLGRTLAELFGLLVKLCVGNTIRQRRGQNPVSNPAIPSVYSNNIASALSNLLIVGLDYAKLPEEHVVKYKLTFLICSAGFTNAILFDDKRYPYHLMLHKFVYQGGLKVFFNTFQWVISIQNTVDTMDGFEHPDLPEGSGEFLDAWLSLLEKIVNTKTLLESPYYIPGRSANASNASLRNLLIFNPLRFLIQTHKITFESLMFMWGKKPLPVYGMRICESMLTILRHIVKADKMIKERLNRGDDLCTTGVFGGLSQAEVNEELLRQLTEMGFSREHAVEAIVQTITVEEATDYLLLHHLHRSTSSTGMDVDLDDDQVLHAIALSLGEPGSCTTEIKECDSDIYSPLSDERIDMFTDSVLRICLNLLRTFPDTIYKVCELLASVMKRAGTRYRDSILSLLLLVIREKYCTLLKSCFFEEYSEDVLKELSESDLTLSLGYYTHLYTLFFEVPSYLEMRSSCAYAVFRSGLAEHCAKMIAMAARFMTEGGKVLELKWLTPILLLLDVFEKVAVSSQRKRCMHRATNRVWRSYDIINGKWNSFSSGNNKLINEAYWNGEQTVQVTVSRRRYTISFGNMMQSNAETGCHKVISMTLQTIGNGYWKYPPDKELASLTEEEKIVSEKEAMRCIPMRGLFLYQRSDVIRSCVGILHHHVDKDVLHAILRLCVRYTRDFENARVFVEEGGVKCLLQLKQSAAFSGYGTLITILIRHLMEEPQTLIHSFEKVIRGRALSSIPPNHRDLSYFFRQLLPAITRAPGTFFDVSKSILRVDCSIFHNANDVDSRLPVRAEPSTRTHAPPLEEDASVKVIIELLYSLLQPVEETVQIVRKQGIPSYTGREIIHLKVIDLFGNSSTPPDILNMVNQDDATTSPKPPTNEKPSESKAAPELNEKPLLAKHSILKILADAVVSYGGVAKLITDFTYTAGCSKYVTEDCSALAFMFDHLLPLTKLSDRDCSMMCRVLIAAIASANHSPEAQVTLVNEVKAALIRAVTMPESFKKHNQVQLMTGIITTIIENCPPSNQLRVFKNQPLNGQINNIVKLMLRKGVFNDLGRLSHYMDLSSPLFPSTINSLLKPMESLSRIVNQPVSNNAGARSNKRPQINLEVGATQSGTTSTEATNAQGEEAVEDAENTEHDISAVASSLEEGVMDQVQNNEGNDANRTFVSHNHHTMEIDEDNVAFEPEPDATEELMSTDSGDSESNTSEPEVNADNEIDDDDLDEADDNDDRTDDDVLMVQYADHELDESLPRMVRWNENGFAVPLFDDGSQVVDHSAPANHPLLMARQNGENVASTNRNARNTTRPRRYQYVNQRNANPPVILQRLLGPVAQNLSINTNGLINSTARDTGRVMVMENFGIIPTNEEQIDFVDQSGYLFGPSLAATLNHVPSVLHWWTEEFKLIDDESANDLALFLCNKLVVNLLIHRNIEIAARFKKKAADKERGKDGDKTKGKGKVNSSSKTFVSTHQQTVEEDENDSDISDSIPEDEHLENTQQYDHLPASNIPRSRTTAPLTLTLVATTARGQPNTYGSWTLLSPGQVALEHRIEDVQRPVQVSSFERTITSNTGQESTNPVNLAEEASSTPESNQNIPSEAIAEDTAMSETQDTSDSAPSSDSESSEDCEELFDEVTAHEDLSEIERVASEGLADRQAHEPYLTARHIGEPNSTNAPLPHHLVGNIYGPPPQVNRRGHPYFPSHRSHFARGATSNSPSFRPYSRNVAVRNHSICPLVPYSHQSVGRRWTFHNGAFPVTFSPPQLYNQPISENIVHPVPQLSQTVQTTASVTIYPEPIDIDSSSSNDEDDIIVGNDADNVSNISSHDDTGTSSVVCLDDTIISVDSEDSLPFESNSTVPSTPASEIGNDNSEESFSEISNELRDSIQERIVDALCEAIARTIESDGENSLESLSEDPNEIAVEDTEEDTIINTEENAAAQDIPEGVDPSFLAALPAEMQHEVLEHFRLMYSSASTSTAATTPGPSCSTAPDSLENPVQEVNAEFLAALPPNLQEEVLTQQRMEQQRRAAAHLNPNEPVDAGAFFNTLQPSLRTTILSDMEESQISVLPPELAAEAQSLRRDWDARNRQMVQERFLQANLSALMRHSARVGSATPRIQNQLPQRAQWGTWENRLDMNGFSSTSLNSRVRGRQLLDYDSLSCLLVLLFFDDPRVNTLRLHRVVRNLCYHVPTRDWIIKALLSVIEKSVSPVVEEPSSTPRRTYKPGPLTSKLTTEKPAKESHWLIIRREAALGCRSDVFIVKRRTTGKWTDCNSSYSITIHPGAAATVCRNAIDLLITLSKNFPLCLLPFKLTEYMDQNPKCSTSASPIKVRDDPVSFWDTLIKLDYIRTKKGKGVIKNTSTNLSNDGEIQVRCDNFDMSPFGQLLTTLRAKVVSRNCQLTDKLLNLLSVITAGLPEVNQNSNSGQSKSKVSKHETIPISNGCLQLVITCIKSRACSEEGLEDAATLLLNLAKSSFTLSKKVINLMIETALCLGKVVRIQIANMANELMNINKAHKRKLPLDTSISSLKGTLIDRFTHEPVIISPTSKMKATCDLQLPSMAPLTSKTSSQVFFLRVLRMIIEVRDIIKKLLLEGETSGFQIHALPCQLQELDKLWDTLSSCLLELEHTPDDHAVLVLQPTVEAFFLVHSPLQGAINKEGLLKPPNPAPIIDNSINLLQNNLDSENLICGDGSRQTLSIDQQKFFNFAEKHRTVLNQILRQSSIHLTDGPFAVLVEYTKVLDFDIKRRYFRTELERMDQGVRREETAVHVHRQSVFEDSFRELFRRAPEEWKHRFYIVFDDEEGQDAGGLLREWYLIISREIFNPMYALFTTSPGDRVTYMINPASHYNSNHLCYYKFVGRVIAKAIYDNKLLECYFTRSLYKHILGTPVKPSDMESEDYTFYRSLVYLIENHVKNIGYDLTFSTEVNEFGVTDTRDLIPDGHKFPVTEENKLEYVRLSCQMKMTGAIRHQLTAFLEGFYDIIPRRLISIFNEQELELMISGLPNIDIDELRAHTEYHKYQSNSLQIQWFWRALRSFDQADRAKFLQFVTGTSKVPLQGFEYLEGMNGVQKFQIHRDDRSTDRLPSAHTCFNQLDLPVYETSSKLKENLLKAIHECSEGFGFA